MVGWDLEGIVVESERTGGGCVDVCVAGAEMWEVVFKIWGWGSEVVVVVIVVVISGSGGGRRC